ncbi:microtubule-associated serine/threonine-protein kinase 2-like isoform X2 [Ornithodoros turicata]|uniref:microtubule-associated serine/threonine-protein kinase 2-like isoform X2 n=1 Tax=Ornithodoros turicata TaxID=34597 RepID=UPI0031399281
MASDKKAAAAERNKASAKLMVTMFPRIPKTAETLLEFVIKRESKVSLLRDPLTHFCQEEIVLHSQECLLKLTKQVITYQDIRDMIENLIALHNMCIKKDPDVARTLGETLRKLTIIIGEVASTLEKISEVPITDWMAVADAIGSKVDKLNPPKQLPFATFIPKMRDFKNLRMLGAGGFGPANFVATIKLVAMDRFSRHKQAAMDKVVASVIRNPCLVKYYACFCVKEAYVTIMEYIAGLDLQRVVSAEEFLSIDAVKIVMAQLIIALEHMHNRGFLHRDIKVSNMLILPGGRVKVIDFDTTKVCSGHFAKRLLRGYCRRTACEFNDAECAGTMPYMAPEILKKRPYGRAADWWSSGIVMYKLLTGRVPFRGKTKQILKERIVTAPLKWPKFEEHPHSATPPAKDMTYRMLKKNPSERLGSKNYADLRSHAFFDDFNWKHIYEKTELVDIQSIKDIMKADSEKRKKTGPDPDDDRKHQQIDDMTDISPEAQKPLLCFASPSFKKLILTVKQKQQIKATDSFMNSGDEFSSGIDYHHTKTKSSSKSTIESTDTAILGAEKIDLILFRKKQFRKFWGFGFSLSRRIAENNKYLIYVDSVKKDSPADRSQVLPLDVVLAVNGTPIGDATVGKVKRMIGQSDEQMVLSVMAASPYRMLTTRRDVMAAIRNSNKETIIVQRAALSCDGGTRPFGLGIVDADTWDDKSKELVRMFMITHAGAATVGKKPLYPGDVITHVDGTALSKLSMELMLQTLSTGRPEATLTIVPFAPFREKRIKLSKLRETAISDSNVPSNTTAAQIEE